MCYPLSASLPLNGLLAFTAASGPLPLPLPFPPCNLSYLLSQTSIAPERGSVNDHAGIRGTNWDCLQQTRHPWHFSFLPGSDKERLKGYPIKSQQSALLADPPSPVRCLHITLHHQTQCLFICVLVYLWPRCDCKLCDSRGFGLGDSPVAVCPGWHSTKWTNVSPLPSGAPRAA